jgi:hypothetical protein
MTKLELINQKEVVKDLVQHVPLIVNTEFDVDYYGRKEFCRLTFTSGEKTYFKDLLTLATYVSGMMRMQEELN